MKNKKPTFDQVSKQFLKASLRHGKPMQNVAQLFKYFDELNSLKPQIDIAQVPKAKNDK